MEEKRTSEEHKNKEIQESFSVKKRTMDLLPDAENNIAKLQVRDQINDRFSFIHLHSSSEINCIWLAFA